MDSAPRILALDLSLTSTGYSLGRDDCGLIKLKTRGAERLSGITRRVQVLAAGVDVVAIEGYSYGSTGRSVFDIGELGGCIRLLLHRLYVPYVAVPPSTLKRWATGKGNAKKVDMVVAARERFGLQGTTDDNEADAFLLWTMAATRYGSMAPLRLPQTHLAALEKVEWPTLDGGPA